MAVTEALRAKLAGVGLDPPGARVLALLPLIHVAWADGTVQRAERALIDRELQILSPTADAAMAVRNWLAFRPSAALVSRGMDALTALLAESGPNAPPPRAIVAYCRRVAAVAGGVLGVGATSREEQAAITRVARALQVGDRRVVPAELPPDDAPAPAAGGGPVTFHTREVPGVRAVAVLVGESGERCPVDRAVALGRGADCDVQIGEDGEVSRRHCTVEQRSGRFYVKDLGSTSGTWVDGDRVLERRLFGGERLRVGASGFTFERRETRLLLTE